LLVKTFDDSPPTESGTIDLMPPYVEIQENEVAIGLELIRTNGSDGMVTVTLDSQDISATLGIDYTLDTNIVSFGDGETDKSFSW
jgi:hypothetical protein